MSNFTRSEILLVSKLKYKVVMLSASVTHHRPKSQGTHYGKYQIPERRVTLCRHGDEW